MQAAANPFAREGVPFGHVPGFHTHSLPPSRSLGVGPGDQQAGSADTASRAASDKPRVRRSCAGALRSTCDARGRAAVPAAPRGPDGLATTGARMALLRRRCFDMNRAQAKFDEDVERRLRSWAKERALFAEGVVRRLETSRVSGERARVAVAPRTHPPTADAFSIASETGRLPHRPSRPRARLSLSVAASYTARGLLAPMPNSAVCKDKSVSQTSGGGGKRQGADSRRRSGAGRAPPSRSATAQVFADEPSPYAQKMHAMVRFCYVAAASACRRSTQINEIIVVINCYHVHWGHTPASCRPVGRGNECKLSMNSEAVQMAHIPRPNRDEQLEEGARLQCRLAALGTRLSARAIEELLVQPCEGAVDQLMLRLPRPGVQASCWVAAVTAAGEKAPGEKKRGTKKRKGKLAKN